MTDLAPTFPLPDRPARQPDRMAAQRRANAANAAFDAAIAARDARARRAEDVGAAHEARSEARNMRPAAERRPANENARPEPPPSDTQPSVPRRPDDPRRETRPRDETVTSDETRPSDAPETRDATQTSPANDVDRQADADSQQSAGGQPQGDGERHRRPNIVAAELPPADPQDEAATPQAALTLIAIQANPNPPAAAIALPAPSDFGSVAPAAPRSGNGPISSFASAAFGKAAEIQTGQGNAGATTGQPAAETFRLPAGTPAKPDPAAIEAAGVADPNAAPPDQPAPDGLVPLAAKPAAHAEPLRHPGAPQPAASADLPVPPQGIAMTIAARLQEGTRRFEIRLDPEDLGRVDISLELGANGQLRATLAVERMETLDLLRRDAPRLEQALRDMGVKAGDGEVQVTLRDNGTATGGRGENAERRLPPEAARTIVLPDAAGDDAALSAAIYNRLLGRPGGVDISI